MSFVAGAMSAADNIVIGLEEDMKKLRSSERQIDWLIRTVQVQSVCKNMQHVSA